MLKKGILLFTLLILLVSVLAGGVLAEDKEVYEMKFGVSNPPKEYHHSWTPYIVFKNEVELRSNGRLQVKIFPGGQLGSIESMVNQVRMGAIEATEPSDGHLASIYPNIQVFSIPYLFSNRMVAWEVLGGPFGQKMIEDMAQKTGLRALFWSENGGFRHYSNDKRLVKTPADMKGLKIRTMNIPLHMKIVEDLGASPTPISWNELYTALQTGVVDGQENSVATFLVPKLEEVQKYIILDGHVYGVNSIVLNEEWYQGLPDDLKEIIHQSAQIALSVNHGLTVAREVKGIEYLKEKGVQIYRPTLEEKVLFKEKTQQSAIDWLNNNLDPDWVKGILEATEKAEKELGLN
ncbi:DctP family TRAP transporter solute-binding subunit [Iocasia frigidifontis]|uniref:DctP family TRAP transporter solute-binding subunit n=1 Tax=Iocasia fonsfrigidae TaxID=2682810 RepID=A0A8A7K6Q4_9FIRM|nr:DctP family TRAP transporter solute-binding subunit [Iocasia fonsfrigidae]QTL97463.1 DctP family TRAP transporter solute-binding subunit [Iocasia fonsfrigidae]